MWSATLHIQCATRGKAGGAMIESVLLEVIYLLFFGLVGMTVIAIALIITLVMILSDKEKTHL